MRFLRHSLTGLFLASMTLGLLCFAGYVLYDAVQTRLSTEPRMPERRERMFTVNVVTAAPQRITPVLTVFGEVRSRRSLEIRARATGTLIELAEAFEEGGQVRQGQLLARIDPADSQAALERANSDVRDARAEVRDAKRSLGLARDELAAAQAQADLRERAFQRQTDLEERGVGTAAAVETAELAASQARQVVITRRQAVAAAEARIDMAETALSRAEISRDEAGRRLADTRITAGFAGSLSDVAVVEGGLVSANERLATLIDADALEVAFRVSTPQFARLLDATGRLRTAPVTVTLEAFGVDLEASGTVTRASPAVGEGQTGRLVFARLDTAPGMRPGDFVTVRIQEPPLADVVRLPASALGADGTVLALGTEDRLEALEVTLLRRQDDDILVRGAALAAREVVTGRSPLLGAGIKVRPIRPEATGPRADAPEMLELSAERRARLIAWVEDSTDMPDAVKTRLLAKLGQDRVPARMIERLETRMGG